MAYKAKYDRREIDLYMQIYAKSSFLLIILIITMFYLIFIYNLFYPLSLFSNLFGVVSSKVPRQFVYEGAVDINTVSRTKCDISSPLWCSYANF